MPAAFNSKGPPCPCDLRNGCLDLLRVRGSKEASRSFAPLEYVPIRILSFCECGREGLDDLGRVKLSENIGLRDPSVQKSSVEDSGTHR